MVAYTRLGSFISAARLARDPLGTLHRGVELRGSAFDHHLLIRTFSDEWLEAGLAGSLREPFVTGRPGRSQPTEFRLVEGVQPLICLSDIPGRSLAQVIEHSRAQQFPLGLSQSLSILGGLTLALRDLHQAGRAHGLLSPHSVWVSFDGLVYLLDAPYAGLLGSLLPRVPEAARALSPYLPPNPKDAQAQDLFGLGVLFCEMMGAEITTAPSPRALLASASEAEPIPPGIHSVLESMVGLEHGKASSQPLLERLEAALYEQDSEASTFNLAFFLHTLFREEAATEATERSAEASSDFTPFLDQALGTPSLESKPDRTNLVRWGLIGATVAILAVGGILFSLRAKSQEAQLFQAQVAQLQRELALSNSKVADIAVEETASRARAAELERARAQAKSEDEKKRIQALIEMEQKKTARLAEEKETALRAQQELKARTLAKVEPERLPAALPQNPMPTAEPQPTATSTPTPSSPASPQPSPTQEAADTRSPELPPVLIRQTAPRTPTIHNASLVNWLKNQNRDLHIVVSVRVDASGTPLKAIIPKSEDRLKDFEEAARAAALASTFKPAQLMGQNVAGWLTFDYNFRKPWMGH